MDDSPRNVSLPGSVFSPEETLSGKIAQCGTVGLQVFPFDGPGTGSHIIIQPEKAPASHQPVRNEHFYRTMGAVDNGVRSPGSGRDQDEISPVVVCRKIHSFYFPEMIRHPAEAGHRRSSPVGQVRRRIHQVKCAAAIEKPIPDREDEYLLQVLMLNPRFVPVDPLRELFQDRHSPVNMEQHHLPPVIFLRIVKIRGFDEGDLLRVEDFPCAIPFAFQPFGMYSVFFYGTEDFHRLTSFSAKGSRRDEALPFDGAVYDQEIFTIKGNVAAAKGGNERGYLEKTAMFRDPECSAMDGARVTAVR